MKLISYFLPEKQGEQLAILVGDKAYNTNALDAKLPDNMMDFLWGEEEMMVSAKAYEAKIKQGGKVKAQAIPAGKLALLCPVPQAVSFRNVVPFRQFLNREYRGEGKAQQAIYDQHLPFSFGNHNSIQGYGEVNCIKAHLSHLDFGIGIAAVIGLGGYNVRLKEAEDYIAGYMIMNQFCAKKWRNVERQMAWDKGKSVDFATVMGPCLVTPDELKAYICNEEAGNTNYEWRMKCFVNGQLIAESQTKMDWTFPEIVAYSAYGTEVYPGEIIGAGQLDLGSLAAINAIKKTNHKLKAGDRIDVFIEGLDGLVSVIQKQQDDYDLFH